MHTQTCIHITTDTCICTQIAKEILAILVTFICTFTHFLSILFSFISISGQFISLLKSAKTTVKLTVRAENPGCQAVPSAAVAVTGERKDSTQSPAVPAPDLDPIPSKSCAVRVLYIHMATPMQRVPSERARAQIIASTGLSWGLW